VLAKRYLVKTTEGQVLEAPEGAFLRVARALSDVEATYGASGTVHFPNFPVISGS
jgi:ribonucleotide reductase alpha subunit